MPEGEASQTQNTSQNASRGAPRARGGRGRGGRGRGGHHHGDQAQIAQGQAAPQQASSESSSTPTANQFQQESAAPGNSSRSSRGGRGRRGPRQSERGGARHSAPRAPLPGPSRRFGGHLTVEVGDADADADADAPSLSAEAPEFVPGQPVLPRAKPRKAEASRQPEVRLHKSTAADLGTRIHEDISNGNYECARLKQRNHGGVPAVTPNYPMSQAPTTAGVERTSIRGPLVPHFLHILAGRHAQNLEGHVLTLVVSNATPALVRRVPLWDLHSLAFVERMLPRNCAEKPITKMAGAVKKFVATFCPAESTFVRTFVILDSVEIVT
ncbi:hypothetical protein ACHAPE_006445 [Trichoderma viride]